MKEERKGGVRNHGCGEKNKRTHHHQTPTQGDERHGVADSSSRAAGSWVIRSILRTYNHIILMIIPRRAGGGLLVMGSVMGSLVSKEPQSKTKGVSPKMQPKCSLIQKNNNQSDLLRFPSAKMDSNT